jgi:hypothetical protein
MAVPYTFGSATTSIPLSQLDSNFATTITLGNTAIQLGNTVTTLNNMTLGNVTVSSGNVVAGIASSTITQSMLASGVAGTGPTFSARNSSNQSITSTTFTKVTLDTEDFDTNNNFASSTFTPTVAGYYQINCTIRISGVAVTGATVAIYKNGSAFTRVAETNSSIGSDFTLSGSSIISCNGTTDTIEMYGLIAATSPNFNFANGTACCRMSGSLIRSA